MEYQIAEELVAISVRRLCDSELIDEMIRSINKGSTQSHVTKRVKDELYELCCSVIEIEYRRIEEEIALLETSIGEGLDYERYLPFEISVEQLVTGNKLENVFQMVAETESFIERLLEDSQSLVSGIIGMSYIRAEIESFSELLNSYLGNMRFKVHEPPECEPPRVFPTHEFELEICKEWPLETKYRHMNTSTRIEQFLHLIREQDAVQKLNNASIFTENYHTSIPSFFEESETRKEPEQNHQSETYYEHIMKQRKVLDAECGAELHRETGRSYRQAKSSQIYPQPPNVEEITAFADVSKPFKFDNFKSSFPKRYDAGELVANIKIEANSSGEDLDLTKGNMFLVQNINQREMFFKIRKWIALQDEEEELRYLAAMIYTDCYEKQELLLCRQNTDVQETKLNLYSERVLNIAAKEPIPKDYAPILTNCGRYVKYLHLRTGQTVNIHPAVAEAQKMISEQCLELENCVVIPEDAELLFFNAHGMALNEWCYIAGIHADSHLSEAIFREIGTFRDEFAAWDAECEEWMLEL